jgi:hypothetical protein
VGRKISTVDMTPEQRAEHHFRTKESEYEAQWKFVNMLKENDPKYAVELSKIDKAMSAMFRAFDNWQHIIKNKFTASTDEAKQLITDALMSNADSLPDIEELTGLERHRAVVSKADDLISALKGWGVSVRTLEIGRPPLCGPCAEELGI